MPECMECFCKVEVYYMYCLLAIQAPTHMVRMTEEKIDINMNPF